MFKWIAKLIEKKKLNKYAKYWGHITDWPLCIKCNEPMEKANGSLWDYEHPGMDGFRCVADRFAFTRLKNG